MSEQATAGRRAYSVHGLEEAPSRGRRIDAGGFEDAALAFLEAWHPETSGEEVSLLVEDCETGERQCFRVDLETGAAEPCD